MSLVRLLTAGKSLVGLTKDQVRYQMSDPRAMPKFGSSGNPFQAKAGKAGASQSNSPVGPSGAVSGGSVARANRGLVVEAVGNSGSVSAEVPVNAAGVCEPRRVSEVCGLDNSDSLRKSDAPRLPDPGAREPNAAEHRDGALDVPDQRGLRSPSAYPYAQGEEHRSVPGTKLGRRQGSGLKQWVSGFKALLGSGHLRPRRKPGPARAVVQPVQGELLLDNVRVLRNDLTDTDLEIVTRPSRREAQAAAPKANTENSVPSETAWDRVATLFGAER